MVANAEIIPTVAPEYAERVGHRQQSQYPEIWTILDNVFDPELPGLTIWDLGILQDVRFDNDTWIIVITLTYSGCPAVDMITQDINSELEKCGYSKVKIEVSLTPTWTTAMMSPAGKQHLNSINIAAPDSQDKVICPQCGSANNDLINQFSSTACKALYRCGDCQEAFDYFKNF